MGIASREYRDKAASAHSDGAIRSEPTISRLLASAAARGRVDATTDWSYVAEKAVGDNWFLVGESPGFADPILSAGLTLTHWSARHAACILEPDRGREDPAWLCADYEAQQIKRVRQHMRFAEYWYSANGCFSDVREFCSQIARDSGLKPNAASAFRWLSNGGLDDVPGQAGTGGCNVAAIKQIQNYWVACTRHSDWPALHISNDPEGRTVYSTARGPAQRPSPEGRA